MTSPFRCTGADAFRGEPYSWGARCAARSAGIARQQDPPIPPRIVGGCEFGRISTLAAATLRQMGFQGAAALEAASRRREAGFPAKVRKGAVSTAGVMPAHV